MRCEVFSFYRIFNFSDARGLPLAKGVKLNNVFLHLFLRCFFIGDDILKSRVALIGIIVENRDSVSKLNAILHEYGEFIIGRMGLPYDKKDISIISVSIDAPEDTINTLSGKLGMLDGVTTKTIYSKI